MFEGEVIAKNVWHEQRKLIKYNQLLANMVILCNVQWMSRKLKALQDKGLPIDAEELQVPSPYRRKHINRLDSYRLNVQWRPRHSPRALISILNHMIRFVLAKISRFPADPHASVAGISRE